MSQIYIKARLQGHVGILELSNPGKYNALPQAGWLSVRPKLNQLIGDGARAIIVKGDGDHFCAGADISEFDTVRKNAETARIYEASNVEAFTHLRNCQVPTIASIKGYCLGGGFGLAAACDLRVASLDAKFAVPAAKLGLGYPVEAMADIVGAIGSQNAKRMLYTADSFTTDTMLSMGFLIEAVPAEKVEEHSHLLADKISNLAPLTHRATKTTVAAIASGDWQHAKFHSDATFESADYAEGRKAFKERRKTKFQGR